MNYPCPLIKCGKPNVINHSQVIMIRMDQISTIPNGTFLLGVWYYRKIISINNPFIIHSCTNYPNIIIQSNKCPNNSPRNVHVLSIHHPFIHASSTKFSLPSHNLTYSYWKWPIWIVLFCFNLPKLVIFHSKLLVEPESTSPLITIKSPLNHH